MISSLATLPSLAFYNQTSGSGPGPGPGGLPTITFTSGGSGAVQGTQNGFKFVRFQSTGNYSFTMSNFNSVSINIVVVGGGGGAQMGQVDNFINSFGGSGGSGGQTLLVNNYTPTSNSITCSARVGLGGIGTYYGNGGLGTSGGVAIEGGNTSGTVYGTTTNNNPENSVSAGQIKCGGGYSEIVASGLFTLRALGGNFGTSTPATTISSNTCPATGQIVTGITATFYQGQAGGSGASNANTPGNGTNGQTISVAGTNLVFGSSGGGACRDQQRQSTSGTNAGKASGSTAPTSYTGYRNPNQWDGFPATANYGAGGGGASGSGGTPYNNPNANYNNLHGGNGSSGVIWIWWTPTAAQTLYESATYYFPFDSSLTNFGTQSQTWTQSSVTYASTGRTNQANALSITRSQASNAGTMATSFQFPSGTNAVASVTLWVRKQETLSADWHVYIYAPLGSASIRFGIFWNFNAKGNNFVLIFAGQNYNFVSADLNTDNWVQLAFTYNRNSNNVKLYINNTVVVNSSFTSWSNLAVNTQLRNYESTVPSLTYNLARLAYWSNKELTASEITTLINDW